MTFRITYSVVDADLSQLHRDFDAALTEVHARLGQTFPSWIDGAAFESGDLLESRAPADRRLLLANVHRTPSTEIPRAVAASRRAQQGWAQRAWQERVQCIKAAADAISARRLELAAVVALEVGKNRLESLGDVEEAADLLRYYAEQVRVSNGFDQPLGALSAGERTRDVLRPYGVFAVIAPFNFPMALAAGMTGAALLAGNSVILKPSEATPYTAQLLFECLRDAGLPDGVLQLLHGEGETIGAALAHADGIDGVAFTGSTQVGMELFRWMTRDRIRPCLLEMGGKNATLVSADANLEDAAMGCARSAFGLSGQKCSALSRIYVAREVHDRFLALLIEQARALKVGDPTRADVFMGPVIDARAVQRFERACTEARADGTVHLGGDVPNGFAHGTFVNPTIVSVPRGHRLLREELFLPFVNVAPFDGFDEAIELVNDADHGLTASIFSQREDEVEAFMQRAEAGILYANRRTGATTGAWPGVQSFCGWKASGSTGKGGCGPYYVAQFAREQSQTRMVSTQ